MRHCPQRFDGKQVNIPGRNIIRGNQLIHPAKRAAEQFQQRLILRFALLNLVKPFLIVEQQKREQQIELLVKEAFHIVVGKLHDADRGTA